MVCVGEWGCCVVKEGRADVPPHHRHPTHHFHTHIPLHPSTPWCGRVEAVREVGWRGGMGVRWCVCGIGGGCDVWCRSRLEGV